MKYLRTFENYKEGRYYWLLPYDDRFVKSLEQIGCDPDYFIHNDLIKKHNLKYIFIYYTEEQLNKWDWDEYKGKLYTEYGKKFGYEFKGTVNIIGDDPQVEINSKKFNI